MNQATTTNLKNVTIYNVKNIKNIRLKNYDYSTNGYYFITICTNFKRQMLIKYKKIIKKEIENLKNINGVAVDYYVIMSDHIHLIIILEDCNLKLGEVIRRFKAITSKITKIKLWQPNYYEHVIKNEKALKKVREYIQNNPLVETINLKEIYGSRSIH